MQNSSFNKFLFQHRSPFSIVCTRSAKFYKSEKIALENPIIFPQFNRNLNLLGQIKHCIIIKEVSSLENKNALPVPTSHLPKH